ncbi:MAG: universal stress protein [Bacteroidetes bacterium]|nr:MAG: universal stress protein [Bacteroidota bacterium]
MENRLNDVLALVPLTDEGKVVLTQAMNLQKLVPYRIFVLNVIPSAPALERLFGSPKVKSIKEEEALKKLTSFLKDFYGGEIPDNVIPLILKGKLVRTLIKQAQIGDFYFLVLKRSPHKKGFGNLLNQNEMEKVIAHSYIPVLSVNEGSSPEKLKNILVPVDISGNTEKKLLWASLFAKKAMAKIQIVSALNINLDEHKSLTAQNASAIRKMLEERGIESEVEILKVNEMDRFETVLNYIETKNTDMVVIRKHQIASYKNTTIGDFAKEIIRRSKVPVFIVSQSQSDISNILHKHL